MAERVSSLRNRTQRLGALGRVGACSPTLPSSWHSWLAGSARFRHALDLKLHALYCGSRRIAIVICNSIQLASRRPKQNTNNRRHQAGRQAASQQAQADKQTNKQSRCTRTKKAAIFNPPFVSNATQHLPSNYYHYYCYYRAEENEAAENGDRNDAVQAELGVRERVVTL